MYKTILLLFLLSSFNVFSKKDTLTFYYDEDWYETTKSESVYYRKMYKRADKLWQVKDYFNNGKLQMTGAFHKKKGKKKEGVFIGYYKNGNKEFEDNYKKGWYEGMSRSWYESGQLCVEEHYGPKSSKTGLWKRWREDGSIDYEINYFEGVLHGVGTYYFENGQISAIEKYNTGIETSKEYFNEDGTPLGEGEKGEMDPQYPNGTKAMAKFIQEHVNYPSKAKEMGERGISYIFFAVEKDGTLSSFKIRKSSGSELLDQEAMRVVKLMPNWIPGKMHNRLVRYNFTLPIHFRLG